MDTSKTYIEMCDCEEVQEGRTTFKRPSSGKTDRTVLDGENVFALLDETSTNERTIWLPRQDQIQEMFLDITETFSKWLLKIELFTHKSMPWDVKVGDGLKTPYWFGTWEQLWLAFYMNEKHNKQWNGEEWE